MLQLLFCGLSTNAWRRYKCRLSRPLGANIASKTRMFWIVIASTLALAAPSSEIRVLKIDGVINPLSARYLERELDHASRDKAQAVVLELNTPGGLESSMREMVQTMLASSIPVVVYVTPQGARAASAGMFLTLAGHVAAMAP